MPSLSTPDDLPSWLKTIVEEIYREKGTAGNINAARNWYNSLWQGVQEGYGQMMESITMESPDYPMLQQLQRDVVKFSNAKDYAMQSAMIRALQDDNGNVRSWSDYRTIAYSIGNVHNESWLKTERDFSIASGQMAAKWQSFVNSAEIMDLLEFDAILDNNTTKTCRSLDGVVEPVNHWFWDTYYPPNHFGCRSTVRQKATGSPTDLSTVHLPDIPAMFKTNLAKSGLIYPTDHPYYKMQQ